jgi:CBS domain-containing protein
MLVASQSTVLSAVTVRDAMRVQTVRLPAASEIGDAIRRLIKFKVNALLATDEHQSPLGVVSKTDIMGAYYAGLPVESPMEYIMMGPLLICGLDDSLESALDTMRSNGVYRLYVRGGDEERIAGVIAYPDIVGLLHQYCRLCDRSLVRRRQRVSREDDPPRARVCEVMNPVVTAYDEDATLFEIMEGLSTHRFGAVLVTGQWGRPAGVISKTDLMLAYRHGLSSETRAGAIVRGPVVSCDEDDYLEEAIQRMVLSDLHRLFVHRGDRALITGVCSLSDAARYRSGSCRACVSSRIRVEDAS